MVQEDLEIREPNSFRKEEGDCGKCGADGVRVFWCHACKRKFCWECFKGHQD